MSRLITFKPPIPFCFTMDVLESCGYSKLYRNAENCNTNNSNSRCGLMVSRTKSHTQNFAMFKKLFMLQFSA